MVGGKSSEKHCCCIVKLTREGRDLFIQRYAGQEWSDGRGKGTKQLIVIQPLQLLPSTTAKGPQYKSKAEARQAFDASHLAELTPPPLMPRGNIGTQISVLLDAINQCKLPASVIKSFKAELPQPHRKRKFGKVPLDYGGNTREYSDDNDDDDDDISAKDDPGPDHAAVHATDPLVRRALTQCDT